MTARRPTTRPHQTDVGRRRARWLRTVLVVLMTAVAANWVAPAITSAATTTTVAKGQLDPAPCHAGQNELAGPMPLADAVANLAGCVVTAIVHMGDQRGLDALAGVRVGTQRVVAAAGREWTAWAAQVRRAPQDLGALPTELQKYVPGSAAWAVSPWMTSPICQGKGGDWSVWVSNAIADIPRLLPVFYTELFADTGVEQDRLRNQAVVAGFQQLSAEFATGVPAGYCVDEVAAWAGPNPAYAPFGFAWGLTHQTSYSCTDGRASEHGTDADNRWVGAERGACDGFFVACDNVRDAQRARCEEWNAFSVRFTERGRALRDAAISRYPARAVATYHTEVAWPWVVLVAGAGVVALAGLGGLILRRRRATTAAAPAGSADGLA